MNFYQQLGPLVLGSRLRRLSENFLAEVNRAYQNEGIGFDAGWFPVFYLLSQNDSLSIKELSEQTGVSHPAASQLVANLKTRNLVASAVCTADGRRQLVQLTAPGKQLLAQVLPVWDAVTLAMEEVLQRDGACKPLLYAITGVEEAFSDKALSRRIGEKLIAGLKEDANG